MYNDLLGAIPIGEIIRFSRTKWEILIIKSKF